LDFLTIKPIIFQEQTGDGSQGLDDVLVGCIRWPQRDRNGQSIDNTLFLSKILKILEADASNPAGFHVWKQFIVECAKRARQNVSRWELVQRVLKKLSTDNPRFWPDHLLLKCGLEASEFLLDSELASTLIVKTLEHDGEVHAPRTDNAFESDLSYLLSDSKEFSFGIKAEANTEDSPNDAFESELSHFMSDSKQFSFGMSAGTDAEDPGNELVQDGTVGREWPAGPSFDETKSIEIDAAADEPTHGASLGSRPVGTAADEPTHGASLELPPVGRSRVVFRDILKGMEICVHGSDMRSGRLILDSVDAFPEAVPVEGKRALYSLALKGFAAIGDFESAEQLLSAMIQNDLKPG
jgi:pentatricopeptide repeat protein